MVPVIEVVFDQLSGENQVLARLNAFPDELQERLRPTIERITAAMLSRVQAGEPVRTGALVDATRSFVDVNEKGMRGRVRILSPPGKSGQHNVYAGALEYGAHARTTVSAHAQTLDHVFDQEISPQQVMVAAYQRDVNIAERRFLRDALADFASEFEREVQLAIVEVADKWNPDSASET